MPLSFFQKFTMATLFCMMNWKGHGMKQWWFVLMCYTRIFLEELKKPMTNLKILPFSSLTFESKTS
jgi:hypothetical protein